MTAKSWWDLVTGLTSFAEADGPSTCMANDIVAALYVPTAPGGEIRDHLSYALRVLGEHVEMDSLWDGAVPIDFGRAVEVISELRQRYDDPFRLTIVGEFNAGKSLLVNVLLRRPGLLPDGVTPTTGTVTEISWASPEDECGQVFDGEGRQVFDGPIAEAVRHTDQRTAEGRRLSGRGAQIRLRVNADILRNLIIIDTPGLGASPLDDRITVDSLHLADAAILVLNALHPGGADSYVLAERLRNTGRRMITIVTRADLPGQHLDAALEQARTIFGDIADGEPIAIGSVEVLDALRALAGSAPGSDAAEAAKARLRQYGDVALSERLTDDFLAGSAASSRALRTLADLHSILRRLESPVVEAARVAEERARQIEADLGEVAQRVRVLMERIPFVEAKVEEAVDLEVGEFISDLSDALDVFIDRTFDRGIAIVPRWLASKVPHPRFKRQLQDHLRDSFQEVFPERQQQIMVERIDRTVSRLMEMEWQSIISEAGPAPEEGWDSAAIVMQVGEHAAKVAAAIALDVAFAIAAALNPAGIIFEVGALLASLGGTATQFTQQPKRMNILKREARVRIRSKRKDLTHQLSNRYFAVNRDTATALIESIKATGDEPQSKMRELRLRAERWRQTQDALRGLAAATDDVQRVLAR